MIPAILLVCVPLFVALVGHSAYRVRQADRDLHGVVTAPAHQRLRTSSANPRRSVTSIRLPSSSTTWPVNRPKT
ncbi:hypothetical protein GS462_17405 [Rhodococcus hoagii]|nr:hypothetical protein [Prescottella equi]MBM4652176.1 hypothetical protein [Prescottella equi]MBM4684079.1 hypothetical protein [Prescottella equi]NKZ77119.1 hypothetical protein [Prescottella equi]